jgi:HSP20 family protein
MADVKVTREAAKKELAPFARFEELFTPAYLFDRPFAMRPFALLRELGDEMTRVFGRAIAKPEIETVFTPIDVKVSQGEMIVTADLPGLKKEDVKVEVTDHALVIEGERKQEHKEEKEGFRRIERSYGKFYRSILLPEGAKVDLTKAELKDGVLTVSIPIPEIKKPRQVPVEESKAKPKAA